MNRRDFLKNLCWGAAAASLPHWQQQVLANGTSGKPNIIVMLADDLGYGDLGCYGCPDIATPNLDQMAAEGVRFTDAYANGPLCSPTRVAFVTGQYQQRLGNHCEDYIGGAAPGVNPRRHPTIAMYLKEQGYRTACFGKWNVGGKDYEDDSAMDYISPSAHGFDYWIGMDHNFHYFLHQNYNYATADWSGPMSLVENDQSYTDPRYITDVLGDKVVEYIQNAGPEPFFIYLPFQAPHSPLQSPDDPDPYDINVEKGTSPEQRPQFIDTVERMDYQIGRIMQALQAKGIDNDTLVMFSSDNGGHEAARNLPLKGFKQSLDEGGIRVPLIMRYPGVIPPGQVTGQMAITLDMTATAMAAGDALPRVDRPLDGIDLLPFVQNTPQPVQQRTLYWRRRTFDWNTQVNNIRAKAIRQGQWKYHHDVQGGAEYLYDLDADISETHNLLASNPAKAAELKSLLEGWEAEVTPDYPPFELPPYKVSDLNKDDLVDEVDLMQLSRDWLKGAQ